MPISQARQMTAPAAGPLLEREAEVAALVAMVEAARDGEGRLVAIEGSAGIGKTRLLAEARGAAAAAGLEILTARGSELEEEFAYGIVRQLFEPLLESAPEELRAELLAGAAGLAAPLFDERELAAVLEGTSGSSFATLHGLYWLAANLASDRPTLLAIDDLHWADAPSLRWLLYLVRRLEGVPLLVLAALRPPQQSRQGLLLTDLVSAAETIPLRLAALGRESVATLACDLFEVEPDERFCSACYDATGGNPLFLRAMLATLAAEGFSPNEEALARVQEVGPEPVARAVSLRLSRLPPEASTLARAVAILGDGAELRHAATLAGLTPAAAIPLATALARGDLLRLEPRLEFTHPIVRSVVYEEIGAAQRVAQHRQAAALLAEAGAEPERAAAHLLLVPPAGDPVVASVLREAARRSRARGAADLAVVHLRRALEEPPGSELGKVLWELGSAERLVDLAAAPQHLAMALGEVIEPAEQAEIVLDYGRTLVFTGRNEEAATVLGDGLERLGRDRRDLRERLQLELIKATWWEGRLYPLAETLLGEVSATERVGRVDTLALLAVLGYHETRLGGDRERADTLLEGSAALAEEALARGLLEDADAVSIFYTVFGLTLTGRVDRATALCDRTLAVARRTGDLIGVSGILGLRGLLEGERGDLRAAEEDLREALELGQEHGVSLHVLFYAGILADVLLELGEPEEAASVLALVRPFPQAPESAHYAHSLHARGRLNLTSKRYEIALADFQAVGGVLEPVGAHNPAFRPWRSQAALALHGLGRRDEALALAQDELELARQWGAQGALGRALRVVGLLESGGPGLELLQEAVSMLEPSPARLEYAEALVDLGAALRRSNQRSEARKLLREGLELAHRCGATPLVERANEELAATGAHRRTILYAGLDALTASERRVAQLAAAGSSNKEIAQELFVTVKTVEMHLSRVYRKLEINSRGQLADALTRPEPEIAAATS